MLSKIINRYANANSPVLAGNYSISPSLRFLDKEVELQYIYTKSRQNFLLARISIILGIVFVNLFGILDFLVGNEAYYDLLIIRTMVFTPLLLFVLWASFQDFFIRNDQKFLSIGMLGSGICIVSLIAVADAPVDNWYYAGIVQLIIYPHLLNLRFILSAPIMVIIILIYNLCVIYVNPIDHDAIINNNFFLVFFTFVSVSTSYILELYQRIDYVQQVQLKESEIRALSLYNEANAANRAKSDFLSVMSHELRSPLISVRGVAEMMEQQFLGPLSDKYRDYATDVRTSADHLVSIINDILDYSKMTGGKWELAAQDIDGAVLIQESITLIQGMLHEKNITVETRISAPLTLNLDARLGRQMLTNLLSNAVKFSPNGTTVSIALERLETGEALISVSDQGKGIPEADLERVLQPFEQVSDPHRRETSGTGLGLPFVVEAMRQHGGILKIESAVNVGTTVRLLFPSPRVIEPHDHFNHATAVDISCAGALARRD